MDALRITNQFVQEEKPWDLKKTNQERLEFVLALSLESLRISGILLKPIVPTLAETLLAKLNITPSQQTFQHTKKNTWSPCAQTNQSIIELDKQKVVLFRKIIIVISLYFQDFANLKINGLYV